MHPMLMTMFADAHGVALRDEADSRRRLKLARPKRSRTLRKPRRAARVAHA